jgi:hypothetical protein
MFVSDPHQQLDELLGTSIAELDMPDAVYARAIARYQHLAQWLAAFWPDSHAGGEVYPQGSIRLGTVTRPINRRDHYDLDLVCRRDLLVTTTTKAGLKADVGLGITRYVATGPDGAPRCSEGNRCWTLEYPGEPFHMDVLPAIPDVESALNGILLADRDMREWQHSNPVDYATWFRARMAAEYRQLREAAAVAKRMDVEDVPDWQVKTTLQRSVQALKRHRDIHFAQQPEDKPASIIITTLAAMAYRRQAALYEVLVDVVGRMPDLIEDRAGILWVPNPVHPEENFADRWRKHPERADRFFDWIEHAHRDFTGFGEERGIDRLVTKLAESFGAEPAHRAADGAGINVRKAREDGLLGISAGTGMLGAARTHAVPQHTFHGDAPSRRRT